MSRLIASLLLLFMAVPAFGQGQLIPWIPENFPNASGSAPNALGFVCTYAAGTSTPLATYSDYTLMAANQNPIRLNSAGRPSYMSAEINIYLGQSSSYKFIVYGPGTSNTCNGTPVGSLLYSRDNISNESVSIDGGSGTEDRIVKFTSAHEIGDSVLFETSGGQIFHGGTTSDISLGTDNAYMTFGTGSGFYATLSNANTSYASFNVLGAEVSIHSGATGAGSLLPISLTTAATSMRMAAADAHVLIGGISATTSDWLSGGTTRVAAIGADAAIGVITGTDDSSVMSIGITLNGEAKIQSTTTGGAGAVLPIVFYTGSTARMWLSTTASQLLLGDITTDLSLSTDSFYVALGNASTAGFVAATDATNASTLSLSVTTGGEVALVAGKTGSGTYQPITMYTNGSLKVTLSTAGLFRWHAYGAGTLTTDASGNITAVSDERLKDLIEGFSGGLDVISKINPIAYNWTAASGMDRDHRYVGFSAQNIQAALPSAVGQMQNGMLTLQDRPILAVTVNAIKELEARVNALEAR